MVLVMLSTTTALYAGMDETVQNRYPREIDITMTDASAAQRPVSYTHLDVYKRQVIYCS